MWRNWWVLLPVLLFPAAFAESPAAPKGPGCTTATVIDWDCDGYGPGSPLGPDADDRDRNVNTSATALAKYGDTRSLLAHLGYNPRRLIFIDNRQKGLKGQPDNEARPYYSWNQVASMVKAGDAVIWRAGTYADQPSLDTSGKSDQPIVLMAYPGERVILDQPQNGITFVAQSNIVIDGLTLQNTFTGYGEGIFFGDPAVNITIRNVEILKRGRGILGMNGLVNVLIERCVLHDTTMEHDIYLGARERANRDITVRYNLLYNAAYNGFQHNGRVTHMVVDSNIIHSNLLSALSFLEGVSDSVVSNNLMYGNGRNCMVVYDYKDPSPFIKPYDQANDLFVNNTCWVGTKNAPGEDISQPAINVESEGLPVSFDNLKFINNIFVTQDYAIFKFGQARFLKTAVIRNNIVWNASGGPYTNSENRDAGFESLNTGDALKNGNVKADPRFRAVDTAWYKSPGNYDFTLREGSPAIGFSLASEAPPTDLLQHSRGPSPDAGAYQSGPAAKARQSAGRRPRVAAFRYKSR
jgi:Right handed beta helix region